MPEPPSQAVQTGRGTSGPAHSPGPHSGSAPLPTAASGTVGAAPQGPSAASAPANGTPRRRHGRAPVRQSQGDAALRRRLVRLAVVPAGVIAVAAAAVVAYVMSVEGSADATGAPAPDTEGVLLWIILGAALLLVCGVVFGAAHAATAQARRALDRQTELRRSIARGQTEIRALLASIEQGERPRPRPRPALPELSAQAETFEFLTHELAHAQHDAEAAVAEAVALVRSTAGGSEEKVEVFVNLARRLQSLVHREIELLDELENRVEDPDLLKGLFHVDHLATRIRRHAENLAVLGGAVSRRQWSRPVTMTEVLRSSIAEVEQYPRVKLVPPIEGTLRGHAVADVIHLLAELVENATVFSAPQTQVLLRAQHVTAGLAIEVEDRGLGMPVAEQNRMNAVLSDPERIDVGELLQDGRIGLFVVSALAQRHGIVVQLQSNIYGGIQAVLVLPRELLGDEPGAAERSGAAVARAANGSNGSHSAGAAGAIGARSGSAGLTADDSRTEQAGSGPAALAAGRQDVRPESGGHAGRTAPGTGEAVGAMPAQRHPGPQPEPQAPSRERHYASSHAPHPHSQAHSQAEPYPDAQPQPQPQPQPHDAQAASSSAQPGPQPGPQPPRQTLPRRSVPGAAQQNGERPELPRRRRQEHLVPELREAPAARDEGSWDPASQGHDPGLMAAFRRGTDRAENSEGNTPSTSPGTGAGAAHPTE